MSVRNGDLTQRVEITFPGEMCTMSWTVNAMAEHLADVAAGLEKAAKDGVQAEVEELHDGGAWQEIM